MSRLAPAAWALALVVLAAAGGGATDQQITGKKLLIRNPTGSETNRLVVGMGRDSPALIPAIGDPTVAGAMLTVIAKGGSSSAVTFTLDASGWQVAGSGFRYRGPTTGDPVSVVIFRRRGFRLALLKAVLRGRVGTASLDVTPPNAGSDGGIILEIPGGDRYCVSFGGGAGGTEVQDDATEWKVVNATATPGCPLPEGATTSTTTTSSSTTTVTIAAPCEPLTPVCNGSCQAGFHCENVPNHGCICVSGGINDCTICDPPCTGADVCMGSYGPLPAVNYVVCGCVTPPACGSAGCSGNCPAGSSCTAPTLGYCDCWF